MKTILFFSSMLITASAHAAFYSLENDWVNGINPNGPWVLEKAINTPFTTVQADYWANGSNQIAWADEPFAQNAHVPVWMKQTDMNPPGGGWDTVAGNIVVHGAVNSRTGSTTTSAVWVSNINGSATVDGMTWLVLQRGRQMDWELLLNGNLLSMGHMVGNGTITSANPFLFSSGSGGIGALTQNVSIGDRLELRYHSLDDFPDLAVVKYNVTTSSVPEPASLAVIGFGTLLLARRKRKA